MKLNEKIAYARKKAGLSQVDLADKLGLSVKTVSSWESGEETPTALDMSELSKALGVSSDWLLSVEEVKEERSETQYRNYPEWVDNLPKMIGGMVKRYGWIYGLYMAIGGLVFLIFGIFMRSMAYNFVFGNSAFSDPFFSPVTNQAWSMFSGISGFVIAIGTIIALGGTVLALVLRNWGRKA